jgi:hypothetical protein
VTIVQRENDQGHRSLEPRLATLEAENAWIKKAVEAIERNTSELVQFTRQLVVLEERTSNIQDYMGHAFEAIEDESKERKQANHELHRKLDSIAEEMPTLKLARGWVFGAMVWGVSMTGGMLWMAAQAMAR